MIIKHYIKNSWNHHTHTASMTPVCCFSPCDYPEFDAAEGARVPPMGPRLSKPSESIRKHLQVWTNLIGTNPHMFFWSLWWDKLSTISIHEFSHLNTTDCYTVTHGVLHLTSESSTSWPCVADVQASPANVGLLHHPQCLEQVVGFKCCASTGFFCGAVRSVNFNGGSWDPYDDGLLSFPFNEVVQSLADPNPKGPWTTSNQTAEKLTTFALVRKAST